MSEPRNHHYIPQCYLRNFAIKRKKEYYTWVSELKTERRYNTNVRNVGSRRDFNKFTIGNSTGNNVENMYSEFEGRLGPTLQRVNSSQTDLDNKDWANILTFLSILAVRHPERRANFLEKIIAQFREAARDADSPDGMRLLLEERGYKTNDNVSLETMKLLQSNDELEWKSEPDALVQFELLAFGDVFRSLKNRAWRVAESSGKDQFITADDPFCLCPLNRETAKRDVSNIDNRKTDVFVSLGPTKLLMGTYDHSNAANKQDEMQVARFNRIILKNQKKVFSKSESFVFQENSGLVKSSNTIFSNQRRTTD